MKDAEDLFPAGKLQFAERIGREPRDDQPHDEGQKRHPHRIEKTEQQRGNSRRRRVGVHAEHLPVWLHGELLR